MLVLFEIYIQKLTIRIENWFWSFHEGYEWNNRCASIHTLHETTEINFQFLIVSILRWNMYMFDPEMVRSAPIYDVLTSCTRSSYTPWYKTDISRTGEDRRKPCRNPWLSQCLSDPWMDKKRITIHARRRHYNENLTRITPCSFSVKSFDGNVGSKSWWCNFFGCKSKYLNRKLI